MGWIANDVALSYGHTDLRGIGTASRSGSKQSKPNLEDELGTAHPKANARGIRA